MTGITAPSESTGAWSQEMIGHLERGVGSHSQSNHCAHCTAVVLGTACASCRKIHGGKEDLAGLK